MEASYVSIPTIAFCDTDAPLDHIDIAIPCNNKAKNSIGLMYWLLAREILRMRGQILRNEPWDVVVDLFIFRNPEEESEKVEDDLAGDFKDYEAVPDGKVLSSWGDEAETTVASGDVDPSWQTEAAAPANSAEWNPPVADGWAAQDASVAPVSATV